MLVGYMRVSSDGDRQVLDLQRDALLAVGVDERDRWRHCLLLLLVLMVRLLVLVLL